MKYMEYFVFCILLTACSPSLAPPFAAQIFSSAPLPTFPPLSFSSYNSSYPLPPPLYPSLQSCSSLPSVTNDQNSTLIINYYESQTLYSCMFMSRYESLLRAAEPIPLYALKLLVSMTEHSTQICR